MVTVTSMAIDKPEWLTSMEAVLEVLNEGVIISNDQQQILFVNSRFIEMTGTPRQELTGAFRFPMLFSSRMGFYRATDLYRVSTRPDALRFCSSSKGRQPSARHHQLAGLRKIRKDF